MLVKWTVWLVFLQILCGNADATANKHRASIDALLGNYALDRGITVLEIGVDTCKYSFRLSRKHNVTCVMMYLGILHDTKQFEVEDAYPNMVIVNPVTLTKNNIETLVRCEHFDLVIVHGLPAQLKKGHELRTDWKKSLELIRQLGDHTFIEVGKSDAEVAQFLIKKGMQSISRDANDLFYEHTPKKGLDIARWNFKHLPWQQNVFRYPIFSSFSKKHYQKKETADLAIPWLKGINLGTFVMLRGICPCEKTLEDNLTAMLSIKHNDLIIGNMIVQGRKIVAIDLDDPRWNGNVQKCITAALTVFNENTIRLKNPDEAMLYYRNYLNKMNKNHS